MLQGYKGTVFSVAFDPSGSRIATGSLGSAGRVSDAQSGADIFEVRQARLHTATSVAFSPDGRHIVTGLHDGTVRVWDTRSGAQLIEFKGHGDQVSSAVFSLDARRIVTGSDDGTARVWDATSGAQLAEFKVQRGARITSAAFGPEGTRIFTASDYHTVRVWDAHWLVNVRGPELVRRACAEKLPGDTKLFTNADALDPILSGLAGTNPCDRVGPLSFEYWRRLAQRWWSPVASPATP